MTIINGIKYSCSSCIKGHRASSCRHTDRPQFEIKRKGRPITQCAHCRELRRTKKLHIKCICAEKAQQGQGVPDSCCTPRSNKNQKASLKSIKHFSSNKLTKNFKDLLNPCDCTKNSHCRCCELICDTPSTKFCKPKGSQVLPLDSTATAVKLESPSHHSSEIIIPSLYPPSNVTIASAKVSGVSSCCGSSNKNTGDPSNKRKFLEISNKDQETLLKGSSYCACGCRSDTFVQPGSRLSLKDLLNPCKCCSGGKKCACNHSIKAAFKPAALATSNSSSCCSQTLPTSQPVVSNLANQTATSSSTNLIQPLQPSFIEPNLTAELDRLYNETLTTSKASCCQTKSAPVISGYSKPFIAQSEVSCSSSCKCSTGKSCCGKCLPNTKTHVIGQDGVRSCGCGCYLSSQECNDCIKDSCTGTLICPS